MRQSLYLSLLIIFGLSLAFGLLPMSVAAQPKDNWSWDQGSIELFDSSSVSVTPYQSCHEHYQTFVVDGEKDQKNVCFDGEQEGTNVGYYVDTTGAMISVVSFRYDNKAYKLGGCDQVSSCLYIPSRDTMVRKQYIINNLVQSLVIYKNASARLVRTTDPSNFVTTYSFNTDQPDYIYQNSSGYAWPIKGVGASSNGQWLGVEFYERGFGLLNLDTF